MTDRFRPACSICGHVDPATFTATQLDAYDFECPRCPAGGYIQLRREPQGVEDAPGNEWLEKILNVAPLEVTEEDLAELACFDAVGIEREGDGFHARFNNEESVSGTLDIVLATVREWLA